MQLLVLWKKTPEKRTEFCEFKFLFLCENCGKVENID